MSETTTPAGWYPDPEVPGGQRYWDGNGWTENRAPGVAAGAAPPPVAAGDPGTTIEDTGRAGDIVSVVGGFVAVVAMFLPWYGPPSDFSGGFTVNAWELPAPTFSRLAGLAALAAGVVALLGLLSRSFPDHFTAANNGRTRGAIVGGLGLFAFLMVIGKVINAESDRFEVDPQYGLVIALVAILVLLAGAALSILSSRQNVVREGAPTNGMATVACVLGAIGVFGGLLSILAVILGFAAAGQVRRAQGNQRGSHLAWVGITLGFVGVASVFVAVLIFALRS
jgi:hypothetical protein